MLYMESTSAPDGTYSLTVTFEIGTDPEHRPGAGAEPRAACAGLAAPAGAGAGRQRAEEEHRDPPDRHARPRPTTSIDSLFLSNYATINLIDALARLPGVGSVKVFGAGSYSMRIWMDPQKLQSFGLEPKDVIDAIRQQNQNIAAGQVGMPPAPTDTAVPVHHRREVAARPAGGIRQHRRQGSDRAGRPAHPSARRRAHRTRLADLFAGLPGQRQAGRRHRASTRRRKPNSLQVGKEVKATMAAMAKRFPEGLHYAIPYDTTIFVQDSIAEVYRRFTRPASWS